MSLSASERRELVKVASCGKTKMGHAGITTEHAVQTCMDAILPRFICERKGRMYSGDWNYDALLDQAMRDAGLPGSYKPPPAPVKTEKEVFMRRVEKGIIAPEFIEEFDKGLIPPPKPFKEEIPFTWDDVPDPKIVIPTPTPFKEEPKTIKGAMPGMTGIVTEKGVVWGESKPTHSEPLKDYGSLKDTTIISDDESVHAEFIRRYEEGLGFAPEVIVRPQKEPETGFVPSGLLETLPEDKAPIKIAPLESLQTPSSYIWIGIAVIGVIVFVLLGKK